MEDRCSDEVLLQEDGINAKLLSEILEQGAIHQANSSNSNTSAGTFTRTRQVGSSGAEPRGAVVER